MCGIAGIVNFKEPGLPSIEILSRMAAALQHRGPDARGFYLDDWAGLAHTRLSIIDLETGNQPISNETNRFWIVFNGEIFNYVELKRGLLERGHLFSTESDTEVIIHLYEEKGAECLKELNGQFALAIWDSENRELFLARDRVGIRPLFYTIHKNCLYFASEIKALFQVRAIPREMDPLAIRQIFTFWSTLRQGTAFRGIFQLPPGHFFIWNQRGHFLKKYWEPTFSSYAEMKFIGSIDDIMDELNFLICDSVRLRLRADVEVGAYLSGGLDSSGVCAVVTRKLRLPIRTFGIRFEKEDLDEGEHQTALAREIRSQHTEFLATNELIGGNLLKCLWHTETPILRTAPVPLLLLSRIVKERGLKVVLTGEGADEVFCGYNIFLEAKVCNFWARRPGSNIRPLLVGRLYPYIFDQRQRGRSFHLAFFSQGLEKVDDPLFSHLLRWGNSRLLQRFFSSELWSDFRGYDPVDDLRASLPDEFSKWGLLERAQFLEMTIFLSNYLLCSQGDRVSMAHAVETRMPYLDHRLIEFMSRVPARWKIRGMDEKHLLKRCYRGLLPERVTGRRKQPYRAPIHEVLLNGDTLNIVEDLCSAKMIRDVGVFDEKKVSLFLENLKKRKKTGTEVEQMALCGIVSTQFIYGMFMKQPHYSNFTMKPPDRIICRGSSSRGQKPI